MPGEDVLNAIQLIPDDLLDVWLYRPLPKGDVAELFKRHCQAFLDEHYPGVYEAEASYDPATRKLEVTIIPLAVEVAVELVEKEDAE